MKYVCIYHAWIPKCQVASSGNKLLALTHDTHQTSYIYNNYSVHMPRTASFTLEKWAI